jgi:oligopeptidase A
LNLYEPAPPDLFFLLFLYANLETPPSSKVKGLPPSALERAAAAYQAHHKGKEQGEGEGEGIKGTASINAEEGPWRLTLDGPSYTAAMQYLDSSHLRKTLYLARTTLASELINNESTSTNTGFSHPDHQEGQEEEEEKEEERKKQEENEKSQDNSDVLLSILRLRQERARLLGVNCHAEISLRNKMAMNEGAVASLFEKLQSPAIQRARSDKKKRKKKKLH